MALRLTPGPVLLASTGPNSWLGLLPRGVEASGTVEIAMPTSVDEIASDDTGAIFLGVGGHTLYGAAVYFDSDAYLWTSVNGVGVDPGVSGTGHEVPLTGSAPFSGTSWATAAETVISAAGRGVSRSTSTLTVTVASPARAAAAAANQAALNGFRDRGDGRIIGAQDLTAGSSVASNTTGWMQVLPADVPSGPFRVIAFGLSRGSDVTDGVMMFCARGGDGDGNPENNTTDHFRTMGNSGANAEHWEFLDHDEVVEYSGGERLWIGVHGDGATSSILGGASVNTGTYQDGSTNLWLTDGTSGSTTPPVSPAGAVTTSLNFGVQAKLLIQVAPYQEDGEYRVIGGAVEGRHDQATLSPTNVDEIFVGWRIEPPAVDDLRWYAPRINLRTNAAGDDEEIRAELWTADGGAAAINGDVLVGHLGNTDVSQGTGWSQVGDADTPLFTVTPGTTYRVTVKGLNASTELEVWAGTVGSGPNNHTDVGYPAYGPGGTPVGESEREVLASIDETQIVFDPQVATVSPNPSDGTVTSPNNLPMIEWVLGKPGPTVTDTTGS